MRVRYVDGVNCPYPLSRGGPGRLYCRASLAPTRRVKKKFSYSSWYPLLLRLSDSRRLIPNPTKLMTWYFGGPDILYLFSLDPSGPATHAIPLAAAVKVQVCLLGHGG